MNDGQLPWQPQMFIPNINFRIMKVKKNRISLKFSWFLLFKVQQFDSSRVKNQNRKRFQKESELKPERKEEKEEKENYKTSF